MNFNKLNGENERQYIWRTSKMVDNGELSWKEFADKVNAEWRTDESEYRDESAYRKPLQAAKAYYEDVFSKMISTEYNDELLSTKRELERAKIQFRDERNAWQKQNYTTARVEQKLDYLEDIIKKYGAEKYKSVEDINPWFTGDQTMIVCLSDLHIGACYDSMWGKYNSDIAQERLEEYLHCAFEIGDRHNIKDVVVLGIGDLVSGSIHKSIQITNRENVIQQIIKASELISWFIGELTKKYSVRFVNVSGNHSRLDHKEDALKDERLDSLIGWYVKNFLSCKSNFEYVEAVDSTLGFVDIQGNPYYVCHGDNDVFGKSGLANLVLATGIKPCGIFYGHMHSSRMEDCADVKLVQSGCLGGSGDDYTVGKRLTGKPSQTICIADREGISCIYPITLR